MCLWSINVRYIAIWAYTDYYKFLPGHIKGQVPSKTGRLEESSTCCCACWLGLLGLTKSSRALGLLFFVNLPSLVVGLERNFCDRKWVEEEEEEEEWFG